MKKELIDKAKNLINDKVVPIKESLIDVDLSPTSTGIAFLDDLMAKERRGIREDDGGFRRGDLVIVSGWSQHGKSLIGLNLMINLIRQGHKAIIFSYEVIINKTYELIEDILFDHGDQTGEGFRNIYATKELKNHDIEWILEKIEEAMEEKGVDVIIIDQLDFVATKSKEANNRREEIGLILEQLKTFAKEKKVIIIMQAQVTKNENNINKPLQMHMLADSRKVYNAPDYIIFVMRDVEEGIPVGNGGTLRLGKNRFNGKNGDAEYHINKFNRLIEGPQMYEQSNFRN